MEVIIAAITAAFVAGLSAGHDGEIKDIRPLTKAAVMSSLLEVRAEVYGERSGLEDYEAILQSISEEANSLLESIHSGSLNLVHLANLAPNVIPLGPLELSPVGEDPDRFFSHLNLIKDQLSHRDWVEQLVLVDDSSIEEAKGLTLILLDNLDVLLNINK